MNGHVLPRSSIAVDFWTTRGCQEHYIHFLSHVHGDHIVGLTSTWTQPIYCSEITAGILCNHYGLPKSLLHHLPLNQATIISIPHSEKTFCVTAFNANHCPGALMFYFQGDFGNIFYTGDFRYSPETMAEHMKALHGKIDVLYLDNTFCSPKCQFPSREECFSRIMDVIKEHPDHSIVIGIRKLGKEDMLVDLGVNLDETIYVSPERLKIIQLLYSTNIFAPLGDVKNQKGRIKTMPFHQVSSSLLFKLNETTPTIAILPSAIFTGLPVKPFSRNPHIHVIPFSDHSSYSELEDFVSLMKPSQIIPIVNSKRGPFSTDVSDRLDMSCFKPLLNSSSPRKFHFNFKKNGTQKSTTDVTKFRTSKTFSLLNWDKELDVSLSLGKPNQSLIYKSTCHNIDSIQQDYSSHSQLKRKGSSSSPFKKRRKTARGICYLDDLSDDQDQNEQEKNYTKERDFKESIQSTSHNCRKSESVFNSSCSEVHGGSENKSVVSDKEDSEDVIFGGQNARHLCFQNVCNQASTCTTSLESIVPSFDNESESTNVSFPNSEKIDKYVENTAIELKESKVDHNNHMSLSSGKNESFKELNVDSVSFSNSLNSKSTIEHNQTDNRHNFLDILYKAQYREEEEKGVSKEHIISSLKSLIEKWEGSKE